MTFALYREHDEECREGIATFRKIVAEFHLQPFQPSPEKAPWHVQARIEGGHYPVLVNFWPHTNKACIEGGMSVTGYEAIRDAIAAALTDDADIFDTSD